MTGPQFSDYFEEQEMSFRIKAGGDIRTQIKAAAQGLKRCLDKLPEGFEPCSLERMRVVDGAKKGKRYIKFTYCFFRERKDQNSRKI